MKRIVLVAVLCIGGAALGGSTAYAQPYDRDRPSTVDRMNHDVQRLWDDTFHPRRASERRAWERRREAERREWCREHGDFERCGPYR
jgi:hypothetical protein